MRKFLVGLFVAYMLVFFGVQAQDTTRILFIGNSYTFGNTGLNSPELPLRLKEMGSLYGKTIITDFAGAGGVTLEKTWRSGKATSKINSGKYDYVVIQEHSLGAFSKSGNFEKYAQKFSELISENMARPVFYMTWARQYRPSMIDTISREYIKMAEECSAIIAPCGYAWDIAGSQYPAIPLYQHDQSHPRPEGILLNTFVFYSTIFGEIPSEPLYKFQFKDTTISEDIARKLMRVAYNATQEINYQVGMPE